MTPDASLYLAVAQIAGIFVGFGGIIGSLGDFRLRTDAAKLLQSVVSLSLGAMTAALIPATLIQFHLDPQTLWQLSAASFLLLLWVGGRIQLDRDCSLELSFGEDLAGLVSPDFTAWLGLAWVPGASAGS